LSPPFSPLSGLSSRFLLVRRSTYIVFYALLLCLIALMVVFPFCMPACLLSFFVEMLLQLSPFVRFPYPFPSGPFRLTMVLYPVCLFFPVFSRRAFVSLLFPGFDVLISTFCSGVRLSSALCSFLFFSPAPRTVAPPCTS